MAESIGMLELRSIPPGLAAADEMLTSADVDLIMATPICPGKFVVVVAGSVSAVKSAMAVGVGMAGEFLLSNQVIDNIHPSLPAALMGTSDVKEVKALGVIETMVAVTAIHAGDIAAKAANIRLMEVRIARGLGGKGFLTFTGEISAVNSAVGAVLAGLQDTGDITSTAVIASPHEKLIDMWS